MQKNKHKGKLIYEGRTKVLYEGVDPGTLIQHFKDEIAFNQDELESFSGKGILNNRISETIMIKLGDIGLETHFIKTINMREQLVKKAEMIRFKVIVRNVAAGGLSERIGIKEGTVLSYPIVEYYLKNTTFEDAIVNDDHIILLGLADKFDIEEIKNYSLRVNDYLSGLFNGIGIRLVDFKLEFGRYEKDHITTIILADEISPDTCRLWDLETNEILDKDRLRRNLGRVMEAYREIATRLRIIDKNNVKKHSDFVALEL